MYYLKLLYSFLERIPLKYIHYKYKYKSIDNISVNNLFISTQLVKSIQLLNNYCIISTTINTIHIYHNENDIVNFINHILLTIQLISYFNNNNITNITINYYLLNNKKYINNKTIFTNHQVNSGTSTKGFNKIIDIWRKEEIIKVTFHELIHALELDFNYTNNDITNYYNNNLLAPILSRIFTKHSNNIIFQGQEITSKGIQG